MKRFIRLILVVLLIVMNFNLTACDSKSIIGEIFDETKSDCIAFDGEDFNQIRIWEKRMKR